MPKPLPPAASRSRPPTSPAAPSGLSPLEASLRAWPLAQDTLLRQWQACQDTWQAQWALNRRLWMGRPRVGLGAPDAPTSDAGLDLSDWAQRSQKLARDGAEQVLNHGLAFYQQLSAQANRAVESAAAPFVERRQRSVPINFHDRRQGG
jgi:hypothetical protein